MNPILRIITIAVVTNALRERYLDILNRNLAPEVMITLRLLRCSSPYSEYIVSLLAEKYYENSYIYSDLEGFVASVVDSQGRPSVSDAMEECLDEIEGEIMDFVSGLGDMRSICISVFNTDLLP